MQLIQLSRATNQALVAGNFAAAANAIAQIDAMLTPKSLGTYLTGCLRYTQTTLTNAVTKGDNLLLQMSTEMASGLKNVKIPQPTPETCSERYMYFHRGIALLENAALGEAFLNATGVYTTGQTPQEIISQVLSLSANGNYYYTLQSVANRFNQALAEAQNNANYTNLIPIYAQLQPPQLANFYVGCFKMMQKKHQKLETCSTWTQCNNGWKHYAETHHLGVYRTPISKPTSTPMS